MTGTTVPITARARDLLASEWIKLRSVRSTYLVLLMSAAVAVAVGIFSAATVKASHLDWATFDPVQTSLAGLLVVQLAFGVFGALAITSEHTTGMIRTTFAAVPRRRAVLAAKATVTAAAALVAGEAIAFAAFFAGQLVLSGKHLPGRHLSVTLADPGVLRAACCRGRRLLPAHRDPGRSRTRHDHQAYRRGYRSGRPHLHPGSDRQRSLARPEQHSRPLRALVGRPVDQLDPRARDELPVRRTVVHGLHRLRGRFAGRCQLPDHAARRLTALIPAYHARFEGRPAHHSNLLEGKSFPCRPTGEELDDLRMSMSLAATRVRPSVFGDRFLEAGPALVALRDQLSSGAARTLPPICTASVVESLR